ncbi:MAG: hypothetical protein QG650_913 [Patescibacteria group bacterium]|nr:hypothetical protein [Patescibacteria group bacterium]
MFRNGKKNGGKRQETRYPRRWKGELVEQFAEYPLPVDFAEFLFFRDRLVKFALFRSQFFRDLHLERDDEVAFASGRELRGAFSPETYRLSMLGSGFHFDFPFTDNGNRNLLYGTESHFRRIEIQMEVEVRSVTMEAFFRFGDRKMKVEIAIAVDTLVSLGTNFDGHAVLNSRGNVDLAVSSEYDVAFAPAFLARMFDDFSSTPATVARYRLFDHAENGLHTLANAAGTTTVGTCLGIPPFLGARSRTVRTYVPTFVDNLFAAALDGFFKSRFDPNFDIVADFPTFSPAS